MAAYGFTLGSADVTSFIGFTNYTYRSSYVPSATGMSINGAIISGSAATNAPIVVTLFRQIFPTNSGTSATLELDSSSTGTATYASSSRNVTGTQNVYPNYKMNAGSRIWYGFRTRSTATIDFYSGDTAGATDEIIRDANGTVTTWNADRNLYARLEWYGVPAAPTSLAVTATTLSSVSLSWVKPTNMGGYTAVTGYRILYKKTSQDGTTWASTGKFGDDSTTSHTVSGLEIGTSYDFKVAAANAATDVYNTDYNPVASTVGTNADITVSTVSGGIWDGSGNWVSPGVKVWDGSWVPASINVWTGSEWKKQ
jgi:hypothetical protein